LLLLLGPSLLFYFSLVWELDPPRSTSTFHTEDFPCPAGISPIILYKGQSFAFLAATFCPIDPVCGVSPLSFFSARSPTTIPPTTLLQTKLKRFSSFPFFNMMKVSFLPPPSAFKPDLFFFSTDARTLSLSYNLLLSIRIPGLRTSSEAFSCDCETASAFFLFPPSHFIMRHNTRILS